MSKSQLNLLNTFKAINYLKNNKHLKSFVQCVARQPNIGKDILGKYISEVSKKVSGLPAAFWITRYTSLDISRLLRDRRLTFTDISDMFGFSSASHFTRYVQTNLGAKPSDFREWTSHNEALKVWFFSEFRRKPNAEPSLLELCWGEALNAMKSEFGKIPRKLC